MKNGPIRGAKSDVVIDAQGKQDCAP